MSLNSAAGALIRNFPGQEILLLVEWCVPVILAPRVSCPKNPQERLSWLCAIDDCEIVGITRTCEVGLFCLISSPVAYKHLFVY